MRQTSFFINAWPAGMDAWGGINQTRHDVWCMSLRKTVSAKRREGFDLTPDMQTKQDLSVVVTLHAGRNGAHVGGNASVYRDSVVQSLLDAYLTTSTERVVSVKISAEKKSSPKKIGGTTIDITWKEA